MGDYSIDIRPLIIGPVILVLFVWGCWEAIDYFWIDEKVESSQPIQPEIRLKVKDNRIDTVYVYREP